MRHLVYGTHLPNVYVNVLEETQPIPIFPHRQRWSAELVFHAWTKMDVTARTESLILPSTNLNFENKIQKYLKSSKHYWR